MAPERILVKEVNWLGDVVMSLPALRAVRQAWPRAHLAVLVKRELAGFFDGIGWINEVLPYHVAPGLRGLADRREIVARLRAQRFALGILFPKSFESAFWVALARVPQRVGIAAQWRRPLLTRSTVLPADVLAVHQVNRYLYLLHQTLGVIGSRDAYGLDVCDRHRTRMQAWLGANRRSASSKLVALAPGAAFGPAKEWPVEHFAALIDLVAQRHGAECVVVGSPGERGKCNEVASASRAGARVAAGETNLGELIALLSLCDGFAGNDSGAMHVAGVLGIPTVGVYGSTNPDRTGPLGPRTRVVYHRLDCSPCLQRTCRYGHYNCLREIAVTEVVSALENLGTFR